MYGLRISSNEGDRRWKMEYFSPWETVFACPPVEGLNCRLEVEVGQIVLL